MGVKNTNNTVKFVCSYGGKILPRKPDCELRYVGGLNRILAVDRSISFSALMAKLEEFCGFSVTLKCQLPDGDLETLVSIRSDEELANLIEEYDKDSRKSPSPPPMKIRAVLTPPAAMPLLKVVSPPPSSASSAEISPKQSPRFWAGRSRDRRRSCSPPVGSVGLRNWCQKFQCCPCCGHGQPPRALCSAALCVGVSMDCRAPQIRRAPIIK